MKKLYAPWRSQYTTRVTEPKDSGSSEQDCVFCQQIKADDDEKHFILGRFGQIIVMLNLYPYNAGHILLLTHQHHAHLEDLNQNDRSELMELATHSGTILKNVLNAQGINIGLNIGKAAGAGMPSHLHLHILPRWIGDTNFLPLLADTKQISTDLHEIYALLRPHFQKLKNK